MNAKLIFLLLLLFLGCASPGNPKKPDSKLITSFTVKGISVVAPVNPIGAKALEPIVDVGANSISVIPYAFCNVTDPVVKYNMNGQWWGESYAGVVETIRLAHEKKLSVMLKPQLWLSRGAYTGALQFPDSSRWKIFEQSYSSYVSEFAHLADSMLVETFCIGTELGSLIQERKYFFPELISSVKKIFKGKLTYAANWDDYGKVDFWPQLDYIGVDAYFPISTDQTPEVSAIEKGWEKYADLLEQASKKNARPILFTEYGYRNVDYAARQPWVEEDLPVNDAAQQNALEGFYRFFEGKSWFVGGYLWKWYVDESRHHRREIDFTPQGKKALESISKWYGLPSSR